MEVSEDLGNEVKKTEAAIHKADVDRQIRELGEEINRTGRDISSEIKKAQDSASEKKKE